jgi:plastocyanin
MSSDRETKPERGFPLFIATLALMISFIALIAVAFKVNSGGDSGATQAAMNAQASTQMHAAGPFEGMPSTAGSTGAAPEKVSLTIKTDEEHAKKGPEGKWHDAYLPAGFTVKPGATVEVTVSNYDEAAHTFTSTGLWTNQMIAGGSATKPAKTTFTFTAPTKKGTYEWHCMMPCDPWAMSHLGYMKGAVTVA